MCDTTWTAWKVASPARPATTARTRRAPTIPAAPTPIWIEPMSRMKWALNGLKVARVS